MMNHHGDQQSLNDEMLRRIRESQADPDRQAREESRANLESMIKRFEQQGQGTAPREYPAGRASHDDDGALVYTVGSDPDKSIIRLDFNKPVTWVGMAPAQAVELAQSLIRHARAVSKEPLTVVLH